MFRQHLHGGGSPSQTMKEIKEAFEKKDYFKVLELTKESKDYEGILYHLSALMGLSRFTEAIAYLKQNQDILYSNNPLRTLDTCFSLRFYLKQFDEAYDDLAEFNDYPYVSQAVEEALRALPKRIRAEEKASYKGNKKKDIDLDPKRSEEALLEDLSLIQVEEIPQYIPQLRTLVASLGKDGARTYALLLLLAGEDSKEIRFLKNGSEFVLTPKELTRPFSDQNHRQFLDIIASKSKDPSLLNVALKLYSQAVLSAYPDNLLEDGKLDDYALSFLSLGASYLNSEATFPPSDPSVKAKIEALLKTAK